MYCTVFFSEITPEQNKEANEKNKTSLYVGGAVGGPLVVIIVVVAIIFFTEKKKLWTVFIIALEFGQMHDLCPHI